MVVVEYFVPEAHIRKVQERFQPQLSSMPRYARYMDGETLEEWIALLGPDVDSFYHPQATAEIVDAMIRVNREQGMSITEIQEVLLRVAAWNHDWGEIIFDDEGVGDISFDQKTEAHELAETAIFHRVVSHIEDGEGKAIIQEAYIQVVRGEDANLWQLFNAAERVGYLLTTIRCFTGVDGKRIRNWRGLIGNSLSNQIGALLEYAQQLPYVRLTLSQTEATITEMFAAILELSEMPQDRDHNPAFDQTKLHQTHQAWQNRAALA